MIELSAHALVQGLINGIVLSWIYILMALGLTLILSIMNIMQFAHGEVYMLGAYVVYFFTMMVKFNPFIAVLLSMIIVAALGLLLERFFFRPLLGKFLPPMAVAIGLMIILQTGVVLGFGTNDKTIPVLWQGVFNILDLWVVSRGRIAAVAVSILATLAIYIFLKRSKYGQAIVASAQHREGAMLQGISPNQMSAMVMAIGSALAALGGALAGGVLILSPFMGTTALIKGILIIVIGGMGSLGGVIVGGFILGLADSLVPLAFGNAAGVIAPLVVVILILIIRPQGLFGHE
jgi:branched-chain amino acid transport system permease protein